jgi:hypothetical protein
MMLTGCYIAAAVRCAPPANRPTLREQHTGVTLISSDHPSRRNTNTGTLTRVMWHRAFRRARALAGDAGSR